MRALGLPTAPAGATAAATGPALATYARDTVALGRAVAAWRGARRHFVVRLAPAEVRARVAARLAALPEAERRIWSAGAAAAVPADTLTFLALALDARGAPIAVANSDVATALFLDAGESGRGAAPADPAALRRDVELFARRYPVGLLVDRVGPVVANDAYARPAVWDAFARDPYHGPRVVWGRELNLFLLGAAARAAAPAGAAADPRLAGDLGAAISRVRSAAEASGFHSELWSYEARGGRVAAARYGTGADVQLWSTTELAVQFALARLGLR